MNELEQNIKVSKGAIFKSQQLIHKKKPEPTKKGISISNTVKSNLISLAMKMTSFNTFILLKLFIEIFKI